MKTLTREMQLLINPNQALDLLIEGNKRFINNLKINRNLLQQANETSDGQHPFAFILSCIDSRTSSELIFDQGLGDIFSARIAGNIINEDILGSMEFAYKIAGSKIIVVLGHTNCGAVKGACDDLQMGNLTLLLNKIKPAIEDENSISINRNSSNHDFVEKVTLIHVKKTIKKIIEKSSILANMIEKKEIKIVGGIHNIKSGIVRFL